MTIIGGILNFITFGKMPPKIFLMKMRYLLLIVNLPIMSVVLPANVIFCFKCIIPALMFDVLELIIDWDNVTFISFDYEATDLMAKKSLNDQTRDLRYRSTNLIINLSTLSFIIYVYLFRVLTVGILKLIIKTKFGE